ncbi:hypothetical protein [Halobellus sp. EA9]|uniref:hypothetical protein n=1 Tax=Halobellus sp. EA9 TaxID=3421647 RepID=UPI003EC01242
MDYPGHRRNRDRPRSNTRSSDESVDADDSDAAVARSQSGPSLGPADVAFLAAIPAVLVGVFALPKPLRVSLGLSYLQPTALTAYTSHFVHLERTHLLANLLVFLAVVPFALLVSVKSGRRRRFYLVAFTFLTVFPLVFSGLNVLFPRPRLGFGFSGVNLAFVGYLPHVLADRLGRDGPESAPVADSVLPLAFFVGTVIVAVRMGLSMLDSVPLAAYTPLLAAGIGSLLSVVVFAHPIAARLRRGDASLSELFPPSVAFGALLFVLMLVIAFPHVSPADGTILNLFVHFLGYSFGFLVPYVAFRLLAVEIDPE